MAPGSHIYTTDIYGSTPSYTYTPDFGGTSAAAPFVAGVAALILSVNPCLSAQGVKDIICQTTQRIRPDLYTYAPDISHPDGNWNEYTGYGLVDAYAALNYTNNTYLQNTNETGTGIRDNLGNVYAGFQVNLDITAGNYIIASGANITIKSPTTILFEPGFIADADGYMDAYIAPFTGDCSPWRPIYKLDGVTLTTANPTDSSANTSVSLGNDSITIFPNPFANKVQIAFNVDKDETPVSIIITDVLGNLVYEKESLFQTGKQNEPIKISASSSLYIVKVCVGNQCTIKKLVKI